MKTEPMEHNIYFVIQPLHYVSRILGLSPFHIDPNYTFRIKCRCTFCHIIQATIMILLLLYGLYISVLETAEYSETVTSVMVRAVWIIYVLVSHLTCILALLFSVTRTRNHMTIVFLLSHADNKLFRNNAKQSAYCFIKSHIFLLT